MGPAANDISPGKPRDLIYRSSYTLHGDGGAVRVGGSYSQKTGDRTALVIDEKTKKHHCLLA